MAIDLKNILITFGSKISILLANFAVVVITLRFWGTEGRGAIALFMANLSLLANVMNIFAGSNVAFFFTKRDKSEIWVQAYLWAFLVSASAATFLHLTQNEGTALLLFAASTLLGFISFHTFTFLAVQKISHYNLATFLQPSLLLIFLVASRILFPTSGYFLYFYAQIASYITVWIMCFIFTKKETGKIEFKLTRKTIAENLNYGWQSELNYILQFLNYRLSFYFLNYYAGQASVGIFSVGVTLSESVWIATRSISLVQYSKALKNGVCEETLKETTKSSVLSIGTSFAIICIALLLPNELYAFVFGKEFFNIKEMLLILSPGILFVSVANVYDNYFSAIGELKILIKKSLFGVIATLALSATIIPTMHINGACITNTSANIISSSILIYFFLKHREKVQKLQ